MNETEEAIATILREHGDVGLDLDTFEAGVRRRGVVYRRRGHLMSRAGIVAAVVALAATATVSWPVAGSGQRSVSDGVAGSPQPLGNDSTANWKLARPPAVAVRYPEELGKVGTDPTRFHLDFVDTPGVTRWRSGHGVESLEVSAIAPGKWVEAFVTRDPNQLPALPPGWRRQQIEGAEALVAQVAAIPAATSVPGDPNAVQVGGSAPHAVVRWQPMPGMWAQVDASGGRDDAVRAMRNVRFDRTYRCAVPFRLEPAGDAHVESCDLTFFNPDDSGQVLGSVGLVEGAFSYRIATTDPAGPFQQDPESNATIGDRRVYVDERDRYGTDVTWVYQPDGRSVTVISDRTGVRDQLMAIIAAFKPVPGDDLSSWPASPLA